MTDTSTAAAPMSPGRYMRLRREAAGFTIEALAELICEEIADAAVNAGELAARLTKLEADEDMPAKAAIRLVHVLALCSQFRFDPNVYWALVGAAQDPAQPVPPICRSCACTWHDACRTDQGGCAWANAEQNLCTACGESPQSGTLRGPRESKRAEVPHAA